MNKIDKDVAKVSDFLQQNYITVNVTRVICNNAFIMCFYSK